MSSYYRGGYTLEVSDYSDYGRATTVYHETTSRPTKLMLGEQLSVTNSSQSIQTTRFTTISRMVIQCSATAIDGTANTTKVTLDWLSSANGAVHNKLDIAAGETVVLSDVTASTVPTLIASAAVNVKVFVSIVGT